MGIDQSIRENALAEVDNLITKLGATAGGRSQNETLELIDRLFSSLAQAGGVTGTNQDVVQSVVSTAVARPLVCAAMLRVLTADRDVLEDDPRLRQINEVFDQMCAQGVYQRRGLSKNSQRFEKMEALRSELSGHEGALKDQLEALRSLEAIPTFRQELLRLCKQPIHKLAIEPFLPVEGLFSGVQELLAAADRVRTASDSEMHTVSLAALKACAEASTAVNRCCTTPARDLLGVLAARLDELIAQRVKIQGFADPAELALEVKAKRYPLQHAGSEVVLRFVVTNSAQGQALDAELQLDAGDHVSFENASRRLGLFAPGSRDVTFVGSVKKPTVGSDVVIAKLEWRDSDGTPREVESMFDLVGQDVDVDWSGLEFAEPYPPEAVTDFQRFVGRAQTLKSLTKTVVGGGNARIEGQRRVGKTSIANALAAKVEEVRPNEFAFIRIEAGDFNSHTAESTVNRLGELIATDVIRSDSRLANVQKPDFMDGISSLTELFRSALEIAPDKKFVLVLDEFDSIAHQELYTHAPIGDGLFQSLRSLASKPNVGFVLIGGERMRWVNATHGQALNKFQLFPVDYFDDDHFEDFMSLLVDPVRDWLTFDEDAVRELHRVTAGNPWLAKVIARDLFERHVENRDSQVTHADAVAAIQGALPKLGTSSFQHFWDDAIRGGSDETERISIVRRKVLMSYAVTMREGGDVGIERVAKAARRYDVDESAALDVLAGFRERSILVSNDADQLSCRVPLFARWLREYGVSEIVVSVGDDDALMRRQRIEESKRPKEDELQFLAGDWRFYGGELIDSLRIRNWLNQFPRPSDQRAMLELLQGVIYFSGERVNHALTELHATVRRILADTGHQIVLEQKQRRRDDLLVCSLDGGGSGANHLLKPYRELNQIFADRVVDASKIPSRIVKFREQIRAVIVVEDFVGTGRTAEASLRRLHEEWSTEAEWPEEIDVFLLVICGFKKGLEKVRRLESSLGLPLTVLSHRELGDADRCFHEGSTVFSSSESRERARELSFDRGQQLEPKNPLGYGGLEGLVCFDYRCPNNSLPVLWSDAPGWTALFPRH